MLWAVVWPRPRRERVEQRARLVHVASDDRVRMLPHRQPDERWKEAARGRHDRRLAEPRVEGHLVWPRRRRTSSFCCPRADADGRKEEAGGLKDEARGAPFLLLFRGAHPFLLSHMRLLRGVGAVGVGVGVGGGAVGGGVCHHHW